MTVARSFFHLFELHATCWASTASISLANTGQPQRLDAAEIRLLLIQPEL